MFKLWGMWLWCCYSLESVQDLHIPSVHSDPDNRLPGLRADLSVYVSSDPLWKEESQVTLESQLSSWHLGFSFGGTKLWSSKIRNVNLEGCSQMLKETGRIEYVRSADNFYQDIDDS